MTDAALASPATFPASAPDSPGTTVLRQRLLSRIHRRYRTVTQPLEFGTVSFPFTRIENPDHVLDQVAEEEDRLEKLRGHPISGDLLHLPYWAELWDSAVGIGMFLSAAPALCARKNVLDLGCGMGLAGTVAAALGANVMFADLEPPALLFAALNSARWQDRVRTRQLNWKSDDIGEKFDLIVGADILYEREQWEFLEPFWRRHLAAGGSILLGEPGRQTGDLFLTWITERGWTLTCVTQPVTTRPIPVRILNIALTTG